MDFLKKGFLISTPVGLYYFIVYCLTEGIPFPLDLSDLPALLTALGLLCLLISALIISYATLSSYVLFDPLNIGYSKIVSASSFKNIQGNKALLINYSVFYALNPIVLLFLALSKSEFTSFIMIFNSFFIPLAFSYYSLSPKRQLFKGEWKIDNFTFIKFAKISVTFFYINLFSLISGFLAIKYILFSFDLESDTAAIISFSIVYFLSFFIFIPPVEKDISERINELGKKKVLYKELLRYPVSYIYLILFLVSLIPNVSYKTASSAFNILNVGGGVERNYYYSINSKITVPPELLKECVDDKNYCVTKKVVVILSFGGVLYVKDREEGLIYSLPSSHLYMIKSMR